MSQLQLSPTSEVIYPDSDGQPMADNTRQFRWIVVIKENLEWLFASDPTVFVAGALLWYPVEGNNTIRTAPDAMVVLGRPKGDRGSYQQWKEDNIPPQVVFEVLSPVIHRMKWIGSCCSTIATASRNITSTIQTVLLCEDSSAAIRAWM